MLMCRRHRAALQLQRSLASLSSPQSSGEVLQRWLKGWDCSPPVTLAHGDEQAAPPTALAWLRRGPLPEAMLHKIFREEAVRVWDPTKGQVRRVGKGAALPEGARLLLPKTLAAEASALRRRRCDSSPSGPAVRQAVEQKNSAGVEEAQQPEAAADAITALRRSVLVNTPDFLAVNKPAGLAVQGGSGVHISIDGLMQRAFEREAGSGSELRLVHRLDQDATGALLLAKSADAAAWLGEAFASGAAALLPGSGAKGGAKAATRAGRGMRPASIEKMYWAVVCSGSRSLRPSGTLTDRVGSADSIGSADAGGGTSRGEGRLAAQTGYKVLATSGPLAWLQLRPVTGRKHQLRVHCARSLGAAILGDTRYGAVRSAPQREILQQIQGGAPPPLLLHCRSLVIKAPGAQAVRVTAPLPAPWVELFKLQGWSLPRDDERAQQGPRRRQPSLKRFAE